MHVESEELHGLPSSVPTRPFVVDPWDLTRGLSFLHLKDEHRNPGLRAEHRQRWLPLERSAVEIWAAGLGTRPIVCPVAPRRGLSSASAAPHWPALGGVLVIVDIGDVAEVAAEGVVEDVDTGLEADVVA